MSVSGTAATGQVEHTLRQVTPGRYDAYEALLRALSTPTTGQIWMLLWHGQAGSP
ncbi:MAG TPA: enhanced serine sensitivity protein SseB, partial [Streptomyces sp.]